MAVKKEVIATETSYLNVLRVLACVAVIMIHVFSPINGYYSSALTKTESYICTVLRNLWQWCVPVFVMISGVLFLNPEKELPLKKLLSKYFLRIILATFVFGIPYAFLELFFDAQYHFRITQLGRAALNVLQGKSWAHMWYLYMVAGLYLVLPLIKIFVAHAERKTIEYMLMLLFVFTSVMPLFETIFSFKFGFYIPINSVYVFYLVLGFYIHHYKITINNALLLSLIILYVLCAVLMPINRNFVNTEGGAIVHGGYNSPLVVMATFAIFCFVRQKGKTNRVIDMISPLCFGIYLIHTLFINFLYKFAKFTPEKYPAMVVILGTLVLTFLLSMLFAYCARKIKIAKEYIL